MSEAALKERLDAIATREPQPGLRAFARPVVEQFLRAPLAAKLAGASMVVIVAVLGATIALHEADGSDSAFIGIAVAGLVISILINIALVRIALRPLRDLESTAERIWRGDFEARVIQSRVADSQMARVGNAFNLILDTLVDDRARARRLASEVIRVGDREREYLGRELHDGAAQRAAGLLYHLSALERTCADPAAREELASLQAQLSVILEELRYVAESAHPRVLDDLGLTAALRQLSRKAGDSSPKVQFELDSTVGRESVDAESALVAYRVAQEAVRNALMHSSATRVAMRAWLDGSTLKLEVSDNGSGFEHDNSMRRPDGMGLFTMRERVRLANGTLDITSIPGGGCTIRAQIPVPERENK